MCIRTVINGGSATDRNIPETQPSFRGSTALPIFGSLSGSVSTCEVMYSIVHARLWKVKF